MSKFIIATFPDEAKAYEGTRALRELHEQGSLSLYDLAVVARGVDGRLAVKQSPSEGALGLTIGSLVGGLVGLLGGPLGGMVGLSGGALLGSISDLYNFGLSQDFLQTLSEEVNPGKVAIVAEVSEDWITPVDSAIKKLGGTVLRRWRLDVEEEQSAREYHALREEHLHRKAEWEQTTTDNKERLSEILNHLHSQAQELLEKVKLRLARLEQNTDAKIKSLSEQATLVTDEAGATIEGRIRQLREDLKRRSGKFQSAWKLTKEAMTV